MSQLVKDLVPVAKQDTLAMNGHAASGEMGNFMAEKGNVLDVGTMKPYFVVNNKTGKKETYITVFTGKNGKGQPTADRNDITAYQAVEVNATGTLRIDEWKLIDDKVLAISEQRLQGFQSLVKAGLTRNIGNGLESTVYTYETSSDAMEAVQTMDGLNKGQADRPVFDSVSVPLPITHSDYSFNARFLAEGRKKGQPISTFAAERATRKVNEKLESTLFTTYTYKDGGGTLYSFLNHPSRNTGTYALGWETAAATGAKILTDVMTMKNALISAFHYGPYNIYIPTQYETKMDEDFKAESDITIRERLLKIENIQNIIVVDTLPDDTVLMVQVTNDVVEILDGMPIQNVQWDMEGGMVTNFKVMTIQVPVVRADQDGNSGVAHYSKA